MPTFGVGTSIAGDLADKGFFNKDISLKEGLDHAVQSSREMVLGSVALAGFGFISHVAKNPVTLKDKAAIWDLGDNHEINTIRIDELVAKGEMPKQEGELKEESY